MKQVPVRVAFFLLFAPLVSWSHPGRLDSSGGHNDRKNGGYHYHRPASSPSPAPAPYVAPQLKKPAVAPVTPSQPTPPSAQPQAAPSVDSTLVEAGMSVGRVVAIHDGDTISILDEQRNMVKIRVHGIDAPESKQAFGNVAKSRASALAIGKMVHYSTKERDRYGRTVSRIILPDGSDFGATMIAEGLAWHYVQYAKNDTKYAEAEKAAREKKAGLWSEGNVVAPWEFRAPPAKAATN